MIHQLQKIGRFGWLTLAILSIHILSAEKPDPKDLTLHMVGNSHIDLAYRWRWNETVDRVGPDTFEGVLRMMEKDPGLTYAQSQMALYEQIQKNNPDLFSRIKEKIADGRWSVVGGQWAECDAILPAGESFIRQFLIGLEYAREELGMERINIGWVPDSFCGQALTLPQIYSGCGMDYYLLRRGAPQGKRVFRWVSPDGSSVLAYAIPFSYSLAPDEGMLPGLLEWFELAGIDHAMLLYGQGDHGGGPRERDVEAIHRLQELEKFPRVIYDTPEAFFKMFSELDREWPVHRGEMGIGVGESGDVPGSWRGSYTSQSRTKMRNRYCENLLLTAEKFATIGSMFQRKPLYPRVDFRELWKIVLRNQFHDILPGTSIGDVFDDAMADYDTVEKEGHRLLRFGLEVIGSRIDTRGKGIPLVIHNPNSWTRTDVAEAKIRFIQRPKKFIVKDHNGEEALFQVNSWSNDGLIARVSILAEDVPGIGYKLYRVFPDQRIERESDLEVRRNSVENEFVRVKWDDAGVTSIYDKRLKEETLAGRGNVLQLLGETGSSSWDLMLSGEEFPLETVEKAEVIESGPVRVVVRWKDRSENSLFIRDLILYADAPRVDFAMTLDWHDHDKVLKVAFPARVKNGRAFYEQPYGYIERSTDGTEWPAQNWVDLSDESFGVSLLNNGKYGFDIKDNVVRMSIVRGARDMDPRMDGGVQSFSYAWYAHSGDWRTGDVAQRALELNQPLVALQENHHAGNLPDWGTWRINEFSLPSEHSFFSINSDHVILSALKVQQGDWSPANVVLRIFETEGRDGVVTVNLPDRPKKIVETNHVEEPREPRTEIVTGEDNFHFRIGHNQIRTFLLEF